ncbi:uncharacterized protein LOC141618852 [Silene latifolia]|uniref:uncharacterized protein LOC141618852 n=1 Tax=Silene latifolia TaxID=37657 RepID=UPI003D7839A4
MAHIQSIPISSITKETARTEQLTVRVMRLWYRKSETKPNDVQGVELILIDQNRDTIQASINKRLTRIFLEHLNEGSTYKIRRFSISSNRVGLDMATYHPCKIWFEYSTRVVPIPNAEIPLCTHAIYTFNEVVIGAMPDRLYIDVIGRLEHVYPIKDSHGKRRRTIVLGNNLNQQLCCSLFGDYVDQISEIEQEFINKRMPTLVILPLLNCTISLTSFSDGDETIFGAPGTAAYYRPILVSANMKTLTEITNLTRGGACVTMAKILELDTSGNSWFQVKFFVTYEASDLLEFIIWDDVMAELLEKTAQAILDEDEEQMRQIVESEPVLNSEEITPQKGVVLMAKASNKSSATKLKKIKMGKQPMAF